MYVVDTKALKKAMIDADIESIIDFSEKAHLDRNTVSDVVNGRIYPSSGVIKKMAATLNLASDMCGNIFFAQELTSDVSKG